VTLRDAAGGAWEVVTRRDEGDGRAQAKVLLHLVDKMLCDVGAEPQALSAVVVGTGPGTFTGVRITVATARALALALEVPVAGVSTLAGLCAAAVATGCEADVVVPVVDARRGQVFYGTYERIGGDGSEALWLRRRPLAVCDRVSLGERVTEELRGDPSGLCGASILVVGEDEALASGLEADMRFAAMSAQAQYLVLGQSLLQEPDEMPEGGRFDAWLRDELAWAGLDREGRGARDVGRLGTPETVKPIYVRSPDADIHITKMRDPFAAKETGR
jgi:tRNA threonylcarbamoyl adenosine modification protein YeaZ